MKTLIKIWELDVSEVLEKMKGRVVSLMLSNGTQVSGTISDKGIYTGPKAKLVFLTKLEEAEYYDCVVSISEIIGIRFRDPLSPRYLTTTKKVKRKS